LVLQNKKAAQKIIKSFFEIIKNFKRDNEVICYSLAHLDGILEDSRNRVKHFLDIMTDFKNPADIIKDLNSFLHRNNTDDNMQRDIASHILAIIIE